ncbi:MAG TPA: DmsC/YnfH family molybdoenzyme membrane anchor subunit [Acidimicrobiales bacterium]|nr:DmsC/YnfH family molybdoenzyme membrane anchor subunit [Acidimicrobiales bacterium]
MDTQDLPLVVFTLLAQLSVGAFVVLGVLHVVAERRSGPARVDKLSDPALYAIGPLMIAALAVSLAHLGDPLHALYTCENFGRSWLSREIVFGVAFAACAIAFAIGHHRSWLTPLVRQLFAGLTALLGLAFIFSQAMIYLIPTIPGWDSWATPVVFFITTFLLGSLAVGADFVVVTSVPRMAAHHGGDTTQLLRQSLRWISLASLGLLGAEFVVEPTYALELSGRGGAAAQSANLLLFGGGSVFIVEMALVFLGAAVIVFLLYQLNTSGRHEQGAHGAAATATLTDRLTVYAVGSAFTLVLAAEVLGRILFYTANVRIGFGGF